LDELRALVINFFLDLDNCDSGFSVCVSTSGGGDTDSTTSGGGDTDVTTSGGGDTDSTETGGGDTTLLSSAGKGALD